MARHPWPLASATLVALAAAGALSVVVWQARLALQEAARAQAMQAFVIGLFERAGVAPTGLQLEAATLRGRARFAADEIGDCILAMLPWAPVVAREQARLPAQAAAFQAQLARCRSANGQPQQARQLIEQALALHTGLLDDEVGGVERLRELAQLHADAGEHVVALRVLDDALGRLRRAAGGRHPLVVELLGDIGNVRLDLDEPAAAERAHAEALVLALETLGPRHPVTVQARLQLASAREARMSAVERR